MESARRVTASRRMGCAAFIEVPFLSKRSGTLKGAAPGVEKTFKGRNRHCARLFVNRFIKVKWRVLGCQPFQ
jgi:hypothetical protein